ncbi:Cupin domain-containing protein [Geodermatophilus saharensis]|uniref:Cupin domain-containing protein n=1 Tax=Geodermatophilus saharensis TaxID=1137994 RepID=A0A239D1T4_9ACTN|nr:cupin domain-containing protein [Geodermatophilus saharensis]SNS26159.1 Cupin domain-containing protein [Geodermatophilus saharensis]
MSQTIPTTRPRVVPPGAGTVTAAVAPGLPTIEVKLAAADGAGLSLVEYRVPPRFSPPPHLHRHTREGAVVYVLAGELHHWFADGDAVAGPGTVVHLPPGAWFRWANERDEPARMLCVFAPAGFEQFFLDVVAAAGAAGGDLRSVIGPLRDRYGDEDHPGR